MDNVSVKMIYLFFFLIHYLLIQFLVISYHFYSVFCCRKDCRGATSHMRVLFKQLDTLNKFKEINEFIRQEAFKRKENRGKLKQTMQNILHQSYYRDAFKDIVSPLNPRQKLDKIKIEKCKFMDSKAKPLWLVFSNEDIGVEDTSIIFKNGDGNYFVVLIFEFFIKNN